jgi:quercetin dioxygenase-like cupin family protein
MRESCNSSRFLHNIFSVPHRYLYKRYFVPEDSPARRSDRYNVSNNFSGMEKEEIEKGDRFVLADAVEYIADSIASRSVLKKATGAVIVTAFDAGKKLQERTSPFDTLIQITEGTAEVFIESRAITLRVGEAIVIPAHMHSYMAAIARFKMVSTTIKSGYEDVA